ncbi:helix-turn-helix transcriptional regulator [Cohnella soli]|uniref:AraC family transcriptional regulator n=1 Tax=Cohnella soli TaxID=425005 RepID=A0ABW0I1L2_9BACL
MLFNMRDSQPRTIGFQYPDRSVITMRLEGIGWEKAESEAYRWHGMKRGQEGAAIFQYTLSGRGELRIGEEVHSLPKNRAFLRTIPGDHEYYLPAGEPHWEFFFVTVHGDDALRHWRVLERKLGPIFELPPKSVPLEVLSSLYADIAGSSISDPYEISATLYRFVLELHRFADAGSQVRRDDIPEPLVQAVAVIRNRFHEDLSLDELAEASGLTKYHFCRSFQKYFGIKPMQYVRKIRIERAVWLLRHTDMKISVIGEACGFAHSNYFIKTFRSIIGSTPGDYRLKSGLPGFDRMEVELRPDAD